MQPTTNSRTVMARTFGLIRGSSRESVSFLPPVPGTFACFCDGTHRLRGGLHSFAAPRLRSSQPYWLPVQAHCRVAHCKRNCDTDSLVGRRAHLSGGLVRVTGVTQEWTHRPFRLRGKNGVGGAACGRNLG